jgi:hypothetical protein
VKSVSEPRANEVIVIEDFFTTGLHMPPHPVLADILCKFWVQLHQPMLDAIVQIDTFTWAVGSCVSYPILY